MSRGTVFALTGILLAAASLAVAILQLQSPVRIQTPDERPELIAKLFNAKAFGSTRQYIEAISGPAIRRNGNSDLYDVGGCFVEVAYVGDGVVGMSLQLSDVCTFDWKDSVASYGFKEPPHKMHFNDVMEISTPYIWVDATLGFFGNAIDYGYHAKIHLDARGSRQEGRPGTYITFEAKLGDEHSWGGENAKVFAKIDELATKKSTSKIGDVARCGDSLDAQEIEAVGQLLVTKVYIGEIGWSAEEECVDTSGIALVPSTPPADKSESRPLAIADERIGKLPLLTEEQRNVLGNWLARNSKYRVLLSADCDCDVAIAETLKEGVFGPQWNPYVAVGDFNADQVADFAVLLRNIADAEFDGTLIVFNGPHTASAQDPAFLDDGWKLKSLKGNSRVGVFFRADGQPPYLLVGPMFSHACILSPKGSSYELTQCNH